MFSWLNALRQYWVPRDFGSTAGEDERRQPDKTPLDKDELIERRKDDNVGGEA